MEHEFSSLSPIDDNEYLLSLEVLQCAVLLDTVTSRSYALKKVFCLNSRWISFEALLGRCRALPKTAEHFKLETERTFDIVRPTH